MRLSCKVELRERNLGSLPCGGKRASASILSIGQKSGCNDVSIVLHTIATKGNTYYKVKGNILKVFSKFIEEGKTTISFSSPPHDLMIQVTDTLQLKSFLNCLRSALLGKQLSKGAGGLSCLDTNVKVVTLKTKLVVTTKAAYPVLEGFPRTIHQLHIMGIEQKTFDSRILKLPLLKVLDLSNNKLRTIPSGLGNLSNLSELCLANNDLGSAALEPGAWDWLKGSHLQSSLNKLDLSSNNIPALPSFLRDCSTIVTLKLDSNQLTILPSGIGKMQALRYLSVANNKLKFLPGSMRLRLLEHLDVSNNPFTGDCITTSEVTLKPLSLKELAARSAISWKIPVSEAIVPYTVFRFMQGCDFCACGSACFNPAHSKIVQCDIRKMAGSVSLGPGESRLVPFRLSMCVDRCIRSKYSELIL